MLIAPSILAADFSQLKDELASIKEADWIHLDVMDGHFVPNLTFGPPLIKALKKHSNQFFDTHLMVSNPEKLLKDYIDAGSDAITFHIEACKDVDALIELIHSYDVLAGLSIKPDTDVTMLEPYLHKIDLILVMSVEPGFGGQSFKPSSLEKIAYLSKAKKENNYHYHISVDGGINDKTAPLCIQEGATVLVAGSTIFNATDRNHMIKSLRHDR